jgi:hypothetical protein
MRQAQQRIGLRNRRQLGVAMALGTILALCASLGIVNAQPPAGGAPPPPSANVTVFAQGLQGPRGIKFGPDGSLYVAEAGMGGTTSTVGQCTQVPEIGPYTGGKTARISKVSASGAPTVVISGLPSTRDAMGEQSSVVGVTDVEFLNGTLYALVGGGGCSHGNPDYPTSVIRVNADGTATRVADLSAWSKDHPVAKPNAADFEPDGSWYGMTSANGALYIIEANRGELLKVTTDGQISRIVDFSATMGHVVPTAIVWYNGNFYVGNLGVFPVTPTSKIWKISPAGDVSVAASGLSTVLGVAFDAQGRMYALEMSTVPNQGPVPGSGMVVRVSASGTLEPVATGLFFPTAMTFGADGTLYVSNMGFGPPVGQIVKVNVNAPPTSAAPASPSASAGAPTTAPPLPPAPTPTTAPPTAPKTGDGGGLPFIRRLGDG